MSSLSLRSKFAVLLGIVLLGNLLTLFFVMNKAANVESQFRAFDRMGVEIQMQTLVVARDTNFVSRLTRSIMLGDNIDRNLEALDKTITVIEKSFQHMTTARSLGADAATNEEFGKLVDGARADTMAFVREAQSRMVKLREIERTPDVLRDAWKIYQKETTPSADKARQSFQRLTDKAKDFLEKSRTQANESLKSMRSTVLLVQTLAMAVTLAFGIFLAAAVIGPLRLAIQSANLVAAGDLSMPIVASSRDEAGQLLTALAGMQSRLGGTISKINALSATLSRTSGELVASAQAVSDNAQSQSDSTSDMAAAIEQMTVSISHITENADDSIAKAYESRDVASEGRRLVGIAVAEIRTIAESVIESAVLIETLTQRSNEISHIVGVIKEIADQTNLLALNAAIEAARAGEQGRGFAVVADEVRKLAERTTKSTKEIKDMLAAVQEATGLVVQQMEASTQRVASGAEQADLARAHMDRIGTSAEGMVTTVRDISSSLTEQTQASTVVSQRVESIANMTEKTSHEAAVVKEAATSLDHVASDLLSAVSVFKVS